MMGRSESNIPLSYKIIIGDSGHMKELPDESVHLVVTSPPYPMIKMWDALFNSADPRIGRHLSSDRVSDIRKAYFLMHAQLEKSFRECARVMIKGGICCVNIGDAVRSIGSSFQLFPNHATIIATLDNLGLITLPYLLWKKPTNKPNAFLGSGFLPTNAYVTIDCEYILIARKGGLRKFKPKDTNRYLSSYSKRERDKWFSQIWEEIPGTQQSRSGTNNRTGAFPIEIPRRLIKMFSIIGDTVLDPFMGTGTTLMAAIETERNFIGYEIDQSVISNKALKAIKHLEIIKR